MDQPVLKQGHHPYRRGERKRTPFKTEQALPPLQGETSLQPTAPNTPVRGSVLLVEPGAALRVRLGKALAEQGYSVAEVATAAEAEAQLAQTTFDLLLLNIDLPDKAGVRLLRALAASLPLAPPLIILPERLPATEQTNAAAPRMELPQPSWLADLLSLVERIRSAPGPPIHPGPAGGVNACTGV